MARMRGGGRSISSRRFASSVRTWKSGDSRSKPAMALPRIRMVADLGKSKIKNDFTSSNLRTSVI
jgi:hypothetical protein